MSKANQRDRDIKLITDPVKKRNAKCKRSKNIMKKAYELSVLCNVDVNVSFYDPKMRKVTDFASNSDFKLYDLSRLIMQGQTSTSDQRSACKLKHKSFTSRDFLDGNGNFNIGINETTCMSENLSDYNEKIDL